MTTFTDTFSGASLGSDWAAPAVSENPSTPSVSGGVASGGGSSARVVAALDTGVITITVVIPTAPSDYAGVGLLYLDGTSQNGYTMYYRKEPGSAQVFFSRYDAGTSTGISNEFVSAPSFPMTLVSTYDPSTDTFTLTHNGTPATSRTNSTYTNLTRAGFALDSDMTLTSFSVDPVVGGLVLPAIDYSTHPKMQFVNRP